MGDVRDQWERTQKKAFSRWVNNSLRKKRYPFVEDLQTGFENGTPLMHLMNCLYSIPIPKHNANPKLRPHKLDNITLALETVAKAGITLHFVKPGQLADHDLKMILGMVWTIIHDYQIKGISVEEMSAKEGLLLWCQRRTAGYRDVNIQDFKGSWSDGMAFNALIHSYNKSLLDFDALDKGNAESNLRQAFTVADEKLGIPPLLDPEDLIDCVPDERSVMTYVSEFFHKFSSQEHRQTAGRRIAKVIDINRTNEELRNAYEGTARPLAEWIQTTTATLSENNYASSTDEIQEQMAQLREFKRTEKPEKVSKKIEAESLYNNLQAKLRLNGRKAYVPPSGLSPSDIRSAWERMEAAEAARNKGLREALKTVEQNELLLRHWANSAKKFNLRVSLFSEEIQGVVQDAQASHTVEAVKGAKSAFDGLSSDHSDLTAEWEKVQQLHSNVNSKNLDPSSFTDLTLAQIQKNWESAQSRYQDGKRALDEELARQEEHDKLRRTFADQANSFADWANDKLARLQADHSGDVDEQVAAIRSILAECKDGAAQVGQLQQSNNAVEDAGIFENEYTQHSFESLQSLWNNLQSVGNQLIKTLESSKLTQSFKMSAEQLAEIKETFNYFDKDQSGGLHSYEMKACMSSLGQDATDEEIDRIMDTWDKNKDGKVEFDEFVEFMVSRLQDSDSSDQIKQAFVALANGKDYILESEMAEILSEEQVAYCKANMTPVSEVEGGYDYNSFVSNCYADV